MRRTHLLAASALTVAVASAAPAAIAGDAPAPSPPPPRSASPATSTSSGSARRAPPSGRRHLPLHEQGPIKHDFKIAGKTSKLISEGQVDVASASASARAATSYVCTVKGHAAAGMKGTFRVR